MAGFHTTVRLSKYDFKDSQFTFHLAPGITTAHIGLAVTQDTSADNQMKLAGDGDPIDGVLYTVEDRVNEGQLVGTVERRFSTKLAIKPGLAGAQIPARGSCLVGAGDGYVRADTSATPTGPKVWSVTTDGFAVAQKLG